MNEITADALRSVIQWHGTWQDMRGPNGTQLKFVGRPAWWIIRDAAGKIVSRHDSRAYALRKAKKLDALETTASAPPLSRAPFACPECGGEYFGRDVTCGEDGRVIVMPTVRCHDQHQKGCKWRGVWPSERKGGDGPA